MNSVVAFASILTASTVALVGSFLLFRLIKTMLALRKVTTGLNSALGWALGNVSAEANDHGSGVISADAALAAGRSAQLGPG